MISLLLFLGLGVAVSNHGRPLELAGVLVVVSSLLDLIFGGSLGEIFFGALIFYPFAAFVYMLVDRYSDSVLATFGILIAAIAVMFGAAYFV